MSQILQGQYYQASKDGYTNRGKQTITFSAKVNHLPVYSRCNKLLKYQQHHIQFGNYDKNGKLEEVYCYQSLEGVKRSSPLKSSGLNYSSVILTPRSNTPKVYRNQIQTGLEKNKKEKQQRTKSPQDQKQKQKQKQKSKQQRSSKNQTTKHQSNYSPKTQPNNPSYNSNQNEKNDTPLIIPSSKSNVNNNTISNDSPRKLRIIQHMNNPLKQSISPQDYPHTHQENPEQTPTRTTINKNNHYQNSQKNGYSNIDPNDFYRVKNDKILQGKITNQKYRSQGIDDEKNQDQCVTQHAVYEPRRLKTFTQYNGYSHNNHQNSKNSANTNKNHHHKHRKQQNNRLIKNDKEYENQQQLLTQLSHLLKKVGNLQHKISQQQYYEQQIPQSYPSSSSSLTQNQDQHYIQKLKNQIAVYDTMIGQLSKQNIILKGGIDKDNSCNKISGCVGHRGCGCSCVGKGNGYRVQDQLRGNGLLYFIVFIVGVLFTKAALC